MRKIQTVRRNQENALNIPDMQTEMVSLEKLGLIVSLCTGGSLFVQEERLAGD